jgi:hypothetical protein
MTNSFDSLADAARHRAQDSTAAAVFPSTLYFAAATSS